MNIRTRDALVKHVNQGHKVKYLLFWGHQQTGTRITKASFSQWYPSPFEHGGDTYATAEHFMMAGKARLFDDHAIAQEIIASKHPGAAKKLGQQVKGFDQHLWHQNKCQIVIQANMTKFEQQPQ